MKKVAFFGHDAGDAAVKRRVAAFQRDGIEIAGLMMRREQDRPRDWDNVDLGQTYDADYGQRMKALISGARRAAKQHQILQQADFFYARNLDMLACAFMTRRLCKVCRPIIYECLDIHTMMTGDGTKSSMMRTAEKALLRRSALLVVSSPGFTRDYFDPVHSDLGGDMPEIYLLENRLTQGGLAPRPGAAVASDQAPLRIGLFGILRCQRSISLLLQLAGQFGERLEIHLHGKPALDQVHDLAGQIAAFPNVQFGGAYRSPEDLPHLYKSIDLVWAGDYFQAGANSDWLLPNRLYEGGYYGVPAIVSKTTETGRWVEKHQVGFTVGADIDVTVPALIERLLADRSAISGYRQTLHNLPLDVFVQPDGEMQRLLSAARKPSVAA